MRVHRLILSGVAGLTMVLMAQVLYSTPAAAGQMPKVEICHFPPGNQANFQTITINANALETHLAHGDFPGPCANDCNLFPAVCDDDDACTVDSCDALTGDCVNAPVSCDAGQTCDSGTGQCESSCTVAFVCPPSDLAGRSLLYHSYTTSELFCRYQVVPNDFFCKYFLSNGLPKQDHDNGFCALVAIPCNS